MHECATILDALGMDRTLQRLATEVVERRGSDPKLALLGVQRRGADLAERLKARIDELRGARTPLGKLDINLYRDDWTTLDTRPSINCTAIPFDIEDASIILVDDVLFSGRTVRAALEAIL
ncbi:MAG: bifunctional pyr operon transcriptional regulator/uracil phosphoribosyltransferase, partial [Desulfovibrionaceae bacterium]